MKAIMFTALKEAVRKKTFIVMGILSCLYLILWTILLYYFNQRDIFDSNSQFEYIASAMLTRMGLQFSSMLLCLLTIMLGAGAIASELENGMVHAMISRPLKRSEYVIGKWLGLLILVKVYATILYFALLAIGYWYHLPTMMELTAFQVIKGWIFYLLVPALVLCITIYGSVRLRVVPNGLLMIFIYILGNIGGMVEMIGNYINSAGVISSGILLSLISPFHTLYNSAERSLLPTSGIIGDMMSNAGGLSGSGRPPSVWMYLYMAMYALFFLYMAVRRFKKMDIN